MRSLVAVAILFVSNLAFGGATSVGDGGHGVRCMTTDGRVTTETLENFIARIEGREVTLAVTGREARAIYFEGLWRAQSKFALTSADVRRMSGVGSFMTAPRCQLRSDEFYRITVELGTEPVDFETISNLPLYEKNCSIVTLAQKPAPAVAARDPHSFPRPEDSECPGSWPVIFVHSGYWRELDDTSRAVLMLHESLRYLPARVKPKTTRELRSLVLELITQR